MMNVLSRLLGWTSIFPATPAVGQNWDPNYKYYWVGDVFGPISIAMYIIMGLVGAAGAIYAIYLGVQLARADDQTKRDDAKKHLITVLIAIAITVVLILFFNELMPIIVQSFLGGNWTAPNPTVPRTA